MSRAFVAFIVALAGTIAAPANAGPDANAHTVHETYIASADGTMLHTRVYRPARLGPKDRTPVILTVSPYVGSGGSLYPTGDPMDLFSMGPGGPDGFAEEARIFERGYSFVTVGLRGFGGSGGCYDYGGPGEQADVKAAVEWAASQSWSTGKVGMIGHSYPGQTQMSALKMRPKGLSAVIVGAPPTGYRNSYTNGVRNFGLGSLGGAYYAASDAYPPGLFAPSEEWVQSLSGVATHPACYAEVPAGTYTSDLDSEYWRVRDLVTPAIGSTIPMLFVHGFNDYNVRATNFLPEFSTLRGPHRAFFGPWDHGIARVGTRFSLVQIEWLDHWLRRKPLRDNASVMVQDVNGRWRTEATWPPNDARPWTMKLNPGSYLSAPGNNGETGVPDAFGAQPPMPLPTGRGSWTFTQPLARAVHLAGLSTLTARIATTIPNVNLIALVYDVDAEGNARFVERGAYRAPGSGAYTFTLYPQDWRFERGHRIGVLLTGADDIWFEQSGTVSEVTVESATLAMPVLPAQRTRFRTDGPFRPREGHAPFTVQPSTIASATEQQELPR